MATPVPNPESYHVGWICAVRTEYVAACELLDEEFLIPPLPHYDDNAYTCGRIGDHNVVVACLPQGRYGLTSAATVTNGMLRSFPAIRFGLMVGIGGGAPSAKHDIRLGDVVVSSGVIYYDFGRTNQDKKLERIGSLSPPPSILLNALQKLSALHEQRGHRIAETVNQMTSTNPRLKRYQRPDPSSDVLYKSSFVHADAEQLCVEICGTGDDRVVSRPVRDPDQDDPVVHYGLIASADRVMKDVRVRDRLAETEGVLCFEMEVAGLMDHFPCVVIRGVCDYSDSHKNDLWQGYATATAAAYAKELLGVVTQEETAHFNTEEFFSIGFSLSDVSQTERFVGRQEELAEIHKTLSDDDTRRTVVLNGLGGIGKTQIAIEYAKRHRAHYSAIFWLKSENEDSLKQSFAKVARRILQEHPSASQLRSANDDGSLDEVVDAVKRWLDHPRNTRWLVVYDNYDDQAVDIHRFLPLAYHGSILITTRSAQVKIGPRILVGKLDVQDSLEILSHSSGRGSVVDGMLCPTGRCVVLIRL